MRLRTAALLMLALTAATGAARAQGIPAGTGGQLSSLPGLAFDVPVVVDMSARSERLGSFAARLTWQPGRLRFDAAAAGSFGAVTWATDSMAQGILRLAGANPAGAAGQVTLGTLRFTPLLNDTASIGVSFSELYAAGSFADLSSSLAVTGGQFCPARGRYGDMDRDGAAGSRDALIALSAAVGINVAPHDTLLGDVDGSGLTNARDALGILTHAVALPTPGFRVGALALGPCASGAAVTIQIAPGVIGTVLPGQFVRLEARAVDGSGGLQTLPDAIWRSSDANVLGVAPNGVVTARNPGTALITAVRAGQDSASITITVGSRRQHFVDATALQAGTAIGSAALPFGLLRDALAIAQDGDTIRVRPGRYEAAMHVIALPKLLIVGDTTAGGQRPVIGGDGAQSGAFGLQLAGVQDVEIRDIAFDNLTVGVNLSGQSGRVRLVGVRGDGLASAMLMTGTLDHLRLERTILRGASTVFSPGGLYLQGLVDTLSLTDSEISDFYGDAIHADDVDSLSLRRTILHHNYGRMIDADNIEALNRGVAVSIDSSQLRLSADDLLDLSDIRSVVVRWSTLENRDDDLINVSSADGHGYVRLLSDSLLGEDNYWMDASYIDSVLVDSVQAHMRDTYAYVYNVRLVRIQDSRFAGLYEMLDASLGSSGPQVTAARVEIRRTEITGDPACGRCGYGIEMDDEIGLVVDSVQFRNLYDAIDVSSDSSIRVTNSLFDNVDYGVYWETDYSPGCSGCGGNPNVTALIRGNTFTNSYYGVEIGGGAAVVDSNTFTGTYYAFEKDGWGNLQLSHNTVTGGEYGFQIDMEDSTSTATIHDNVVTGIDYYAVEVEGNSSFGMQFSFDIRRNVVTCSGIYSSSYGIMAEEGISYVADNQVGNCAYAIDLWNGGSTPLPDTLLRNVVQLPPNSYSGIRVRGQWASVVRGNHISGDSTAANSYGMLVVEGNGFATALVERDTIIGGGYSGIVVNDLDTAIVRYNQISDVMGQLSGTGGVVVEGSMSGDTARVYGNSIRRGHIGMSLINFSTAPVRVDSNLISLQSLVGIDVQYLGEMLIRHNTIDSADYGVRGAGATITLDSNNIQGNRIFGATNHTGTMTALRNWWGAASGPRCDTICGSGDSIAPGIAFLPVLTAPVGAAPPITAPPVFPVIASRAAFAAPAAGAAERRVPASPRPAPAAAVRAPRDPGAVPVLPPAVTERLSRTRSERDAEERAREQRRAEQRRERAAERDARWLATQQEAAAREQQRRAAPPPRPARRQP